jgi:hypothetical protein
MRWMIVGILSVTMVPLAWGQAQSDGGPGEAGPMMRHGFGPHHGEGRGSWHPSDKEWADIQQFMKENSPRRWNAYINDLSDEQQGNLKRTIIRRYFALQLLKSSQPKMYQARLERMRVEDDVFGLRRDLKEAAPTEKGKIEAKLKSKLGKLVDLSVQEHRMRIERFQELIAHEQEQLSHEQNDRQHIIEEQLRKIENERGRLGGTGPTTAPTTQRSTDDHAP